MDRFSIAKGDEPPPEPNPPSGVYQQGEEQFPGSWTTERRTILPSFELSPPTDSLRGRRQALERASAREPMGNWDPLRPPAVDNGPNNDGAPSARMERHRQFRHHPPAAPQGDLLSRQIPASFLISNGEGSERNFIRIYPGDIYVSTNSVSGDLFNVSLNFQATREQLDTLLGP